MARSFNGITNKIVSTSMSTSLVPQSGATAWTASLWVTATSTAAGSPCAFAFGQASTGYSCQIGRSAGNWYTVNFYPSATPNNRNIIGSAVSTNTMTHLCVTLVGTKTSLYINGGAPTTDDPSVSWGRAGTNNQCSIGNDQSDGGAGGVNFWNGIVADVALWNGATLNAGEISALAAGLRPYMIRRGSLTYYMPLDGLSSPEPDLSGNKNNGTVTGATAASGPPIAFFTPRWPSNALISAGPAAPQIYSFDQVGAHITRKITSLGY